MQPRYWVMLGILVVLVFMAVRTNAALNRIEDQVSLA